MLKAISSYPPEQRKAVVERRLARPGMGNGYFAAQAAAPHFGLSPNKARKVSKKQFDRDQKKQGQEFAKKFVERKKEVRRRPVHQNKMRIAS